MEMWMNKPGEKGVSHRWDELAAAIAQKNPTFKRSGSACRKRFYVLLRLEKKAQTRALQTTGEGEDVSNHVELMNDLLNRFRDQDEQPRPKNDVAKAKAEIEKAAGKEMRNAAMKDLVHREDLTDITRVGGSTGRERAAQRTERKRAKPDVTGKSGTGEGSSAKKPRIDTKSELCDIVAARNASDKAALEEANRLDQERHNETRKAIEGMTGKLDELTNVLKEDLHHRATENKELWSVVKAMIKK
ncbi:hypothetical protein RhiJN_23956 [Ceratobasidium sp. AG-Ba]|nr:hypothetical protein RhiJN_23956 [Ceratobasidium sp. AG-Ba]